MPPPLGQPPPQDMLGTIEEVFDVEVAVLGRYVKVYTVVEEGCRKVQL